MALDKPNHTKPTETPQKGSPDRIVVIGDLDLFRTEFLAIQEKIESSRTNNRRILYYAGCCVSFGETRDKHYKSHNTQDIELFATDKDICWPGLEKKVQEDAKTQKNQFIIPRIGIIHTEEVCFRKKYYVVADLLIEACSHHRSLYEIVRNSVNKPCKQDQTGLGKRIVTSNTTDNEDEKNSTVKLSSRKVLE